MEASQIFDRLMHGMGSQKHLKIENKPFMPLTIEKIGNGIETPYGKGELYSLCHYYEEYGDLMQDPEMCFVVVDNRDGDTLIPELLVILPYMFQQSGIGLYQESITIKDSRLNQFNRRLQAEHTSFANQWLRNIRSQGFLERI